MTRIGTLWRTARHLRATQIIGRVKFRLWRPGIDSAPAPGLRRCKAAWTKSPERAASVTAPWVLKLLNDERDLNAVGWDDPSLAKLWRYNLHYFDDLNAAQNECRTPFHHQLIQRWIAENPPVAGSGWEPYPTSLRIVNWIKWFLRETPREEYLNSLAVQVRWLEGRLEFHLLGNHLFANAKALMFAGLFFEGKESQRWLDRGTQIVEHELQEQILPDGGQFERTPMYQALALEDLLDLVNVCEVFVASPKYQALCADWRRVGRRMLRWLRCMTHPDGAYSHFNDCAQGLAPTMHELERYAHELGVTSPPLEREAVTRLQESGYVRMSRGACTILFDAAEVGPDYLPGHAHADTLSLELSLGKRRILVNGGTSCYGLGEQRMFERGTPAHNTVTVDSRNSSEVWSGFRVGRRARPFGYMQAGWRVCCSHDGYRFLAGRPDHQRCIELLDRELLVADRISAAELSAIARYNLMPGLRWRLLGSEAWEIVDADLVIATVAVERGRGSIRPAAYSPEFGVVQATECLEVELIDGECATRWIWTNDAYPVSDR